ncbi:FAD-binding oxidoreductase [Jiella endophytica]|uniref:FAD-binding oxidoreductase n=1 Tax=Jiella endophytica TaxID=2558362 RepID=UPI001FDF82C1|nr:FAD-binding oxidoreductase [Jiella endophytica]
MDIDAFRRDLGDIPVEDNPKLVLQKSRDFYWYSPVLKRQLDHVTADLVVTPRTIDDVVTTLASAHRHGVPVTPRGAGTGNYGQAMPLSGGAVLNLAGLTKVVASSPMTVRAEAGAILARIDEETRAAHGAEMRFHPSTYRTATIGGFVAGGSGGVGSIRWGGLRNFGNIISLKVVTCEASPRILDIEGTDILKVAHAYGTNGIIVEAEVPLTAGYDWVDVLAGFDTIEDAVRFARNVALQDGMLLKEIAPIAAPVPHDYFVRHQKFIRKDQSVVVMMAAPQAMAALSIFLAHEKGEMLYRSDAASEEDLKRLPPAYELAWNHTTLRGLKVDPSITYLQTQYPDLETLKKIIALLGDEMPMHNEMIRFDGRVVFSGLPIVRFSTEERLEEIIRIHEDNGCLVFNPHRYTLEEGGMKRSDPGQLAFKREADPKGILNPGKMIAWENPDFDFASGKAWLFSGLQSAGAD